MPMSALEAAVAESETALAALSQALLEHDGAAIERSAAALQQSLTRALDAGTRTARQGALAPALRQRLQRIAGSVAAQRHSLARAGALLDRTIEVLLPRQAAGYTARGTTELPAGRGAARA